jgi:hypothetical protein
VIPIDQRNVVGGERRLKRAVVGSKMMFGKSEREVSGWIKQRRPDKEAQKRSQKRLKKIAMRRSMARSQRGITSEEDGS